jgi:hypothetical protein
MGGSERIVTRDCGTVSVIFPVTRDPFASLRPFTWSMSASLPGPEYVARDE